MGPRVKEKNNDKRMKLKAKIKRKVLNVSYEGNTYIRGVYV